MNDDDDRQMMDKGDLADDDCQNGLSMMMMLAKEDLSLFDNEKNRLNDQSLNILESKKYFHNRKMIEMIYQVQCMI